MAISGGLNTDLTFSQNDFEVTLGNGGTISSSTRFTFDNYDFSASSGDGLNISGATDIQVSNNRFTPVGTCP